MSETTEQQWTIKRLLDWTTDYFAKVNPDTPRLDAEVLLAETLQCQRVMLYIQFDRVLEGELLAQFRAAVKRRAAGEPVAYIVGRWEFYSLEFLVNPHVLIPRPETEHVVVAALDMAKEILAGRAADVASNTEKDTEIDTEKDAEIDTEIDTENDTQKNTETASSTPPAPLRIVDLGTGSGCIAIALAKHLPHCRIGAIDISSEALAVATSNVAKHEVSDKVRLLRGDLFAALPAGSGKVDLIVSNPPYIGTAEQGTVEPAVAQFEPAQALFAGPDGMQVIDRIIAEAPQWLNPNGALIFEMSPLIADQCMARFREDQDSVWQTPRVIKDLAGHRRVLVVKRK